MENKLPQIMDVAERMARDGGYNGFSFREIAGEIGIKSASIHYHFPTKVDLGVALAHRYTDRFLKKLGDPKIHMDKKRDPLKTYVKVFKNAVLQDGQMCLCGLLAAEASHLPQEVFDATRVFFDRNLDWLKETYQLKNAAASSASQKALQTLTMLEGAALVSQILKDGSAFKAVEKMIIQ